MWWSSRVHVFLVWFFTQLLQSIGVWKDLNVYMSFEWWILPWPNFSCFSDNEINSIMFCVLEMIVCLEGFIGPSKSFSWIRNNVLFTLYSVYILVFQNIIEKHSLHNFIRNNLFRFYLSSISFILYKFFTLPCFCWKVTFPVFGKIGTIVLSLLWHQPSKH